MSNVNYITGLEPRTKIHVGNRVVGEVRGDVFHKSIFGSKHMLRTPRAIALDTGSLDDAEKAGARWVHIYDRETGTTYKATVEHIRRKGFELNRRYGDQLALPLKGWIRNGQGYQLELFAG